MREHLRATRFRPLDIVVLVVAAALVLQAPLSVVEAHWVAHLEALPRLALMGLLAGYLIERTRLIGPLGLLLGVLLGVELVTWTFAPIAPPDTFGDRVSWLGGRVGAWIDSVAAGGVSNDPLVFALAMGALAWLIGLVTGWLLFRDNAPWLAIVFNGVALLMNLSYAPASMVGYIGPFVLATCLLLAVQQLATRTELWRRAEPAVSWRVIVNMLIGTTMATGALLSVAWALPANLSSPQVAANFTRVTQPWQGLETEFDRWFAAINSSDRNARGLSFGRTLAPRGAFDLGDTPVLQVRASAPVYLRATTADRYAGQAITSTETSTNPFEANTDLLTSEQIPAGRGLLQAQIKVLASRTSVAFTPDTPLRISQSAEVDTRGDPLDIATVRLDSAVVQNGEYTVVSAVSTATIADLRTAGQDYPDWVRRRYLQLPRSLPRRVVDIARTASDTALSGYDRAAAIEGYLRDNFTYSTHVTAPAPDTDWVDFFLFDSKQGYCDYFATAMTVMLRSQGIPARVASGFAPGEFDPTTGVSLVRENHAHSWVEVYFPRYGWITFEPSAIRALPARTESAPPPSPAAAPQQATAPDPAQLTQAEQDELQGLRDRTTTAPASAFADSIVGKFLILAGVLAVLVLAGYAGARIAWGRGLRGLTRYQLPYAQLLRLGHWSGLVRVATGDTPHDVAQRMRTHVPNARDTIDQLTDAYAARTYGARLPTSDPWPQWVAARRDIARQLFGRRAAAFKRWRRSAPD
ncbi:MAG: transglutaminaseTgpA domain-containing protein [Chloroflexota bacterium]